jgi:hypothetical protein
VKPGKAANVTIDTNFYGVTPLTNGTDEPGKELEYVDPLNPASSASIPLSYRSQL